MVRCLGIYPVGSLIALNTGERGIVIAVNPGKALQPVVYILWDQTQQRDGHAGDDRPRCSCS